MISKFFRFLTVSLLLIPSLAFASISVDSVSQSSSSGGGSPITWSHTVSGNFLLVCSLGPTTGDSFNATATYNGSSLTELGHTTANGGGGWFITAWGEVNPPAGTHNVVVSGSNQIGGSAISYNGVDVSGGLPSFNTVTSGATSETSYTISSTVSVDQSWLSACVSMADNPWSAGSGTVLESACNGAPYCGIFDSGAGLSPGSQSLNLTSSGDRVGAVYGLLIPAGAPTPTPTPTATSTLDGFGIWGAVTTSTLSLVSDTGLPLWEIGIGLLLAFCFIFLLVVITSRSVKWLMRKH